MSKPSARIPLVISLAFVVIGIVLGAINGLGSGSIVGGIIAACGIIPAAWAAWAGMQEETQKSLAGALAMVFVSIGVGAILLILGIIDFVRS